MHATTAAIDLAKNVFQVAIADADNRVVKQHRLSRVQFERSSPTDRSIASSWKPVARPIIVSTSE